MMDRSAHLATILAKPEPEDYTESLVFALRFVPSGRIHQGCYVYKFDDFKRI